MGASQFMDNRKRCVPKGSRLGGKNSPAFERRGLTVSQQVPQGRLKKPFFSAVPVGLDVFPTCPGIKCRAIFDGSFGTEQLLKN
jgi:hypothetical protein